MSEIAVIRKIQGKKSHYITVSQAMLPASDRITVTVVARRYWIDGAGDAYVHLAKTVGRSRIYGSVKIVINKEVVEALGILNEKQAWIRIVPFTEKPQPPPAHPYIAKPTKVHFDGSSLFFVISKQQVETLASFTPPELRGPNLYVSVTASGRTIDYIKRPTLVKNRNYYKVVLPSELFGDKVRPGDVVLAKIQVTNKPEELYYV